MRIGVTAPQIGPAVNPAAMRSAAVAAEAVGYASIWVRDEPEGLDPLAVLGAAAAVTNRVRLGLGSLRVAAYRPPTLTRSLAAIDVLSDGRLVVGVTGAPGAEAERLRAELGRDGPPVLLDAATAGALNHVARWADGWTPDLGTGELAAGWARIRALAAGHGRDPDALQLVVRCTVALAGRASGSARRPGCGTPLQIAADLDGVRRAGADEVVLAVGGPAGLDECLDAYARIAEAVEERCGGALT